MTKQIRLRIYLGEADKFQHKPLYQEIVERAHTAGLAGASAFRGIAGFGAQSVLHEPHLLRLSSDLPILIELIDSKNKIDDFLKVVEPLLAGSLITEDEVVCQTRVLSATPSQ